MRVTQQIGLSWWTIPAYAAASIALVAIEWWLARRARR
jgi:hypothetical protein